MRLGRWCLLPAALLTACAPTLLFGNRDAGLHVGLALQNPRSGGAVRLEDGAVLSVRADAAARLNLFVVGPGEGVTRAGPEVALAAGEVRRVDLAPVAVGPYQAVAVVSRGALTFSGAELAATRRNTGLEALVKAAVAGQPNESWNVGSLYFRVAQYGGLQVQGLPSGARVQIDGEGVGRAPLLAREVEAGPRQVEVTAPGFRPWIRRVEVPAGGQASLYYDLAPLPPTGQLNVSSELPASVAVNGRGLGGTPLGAPLEAGPLSVTVTPQDRALGAYTAGAVLPPGGAVNLSCRLSGGSFGCSVVTLGHF